jgi:hypothetical protein
MVKKNTVQILLAALLVFGFAAFLHADEDNEEQTAIKDQAVELAPEDMPDAQRIMALHRFVRDEIRQIKTQYG